MKAKTTKKLDVKFLLAEDVRLEAGSKLSMLGVFPGEHVFVGGSPPPNLPNNPAIVLPSLVFVFLITGPMTRTLRGRFRVVAPDKRTIVHDMPAEIDAKSGSAATFVTGAKPFIAPTFGTYTVKLDLNSTKYAFPVVIEKASAAAIRRVKKGLG